MLPFHIGSLSGFKSLEYLMWTLLLADMAKKDLVQMRFDVSSSEDFRVR